VLILSASQAESYDPEQPGGCPRRWWFERVERRERPDSASAGDGTAGHALFATHLRGQPLPKRARMLKAVRGALHHLPPQWPGTLVESRFDGQPSHSADGERLALDTARTLWLGGVPWDGYVDLRWRDGDTVTVWDHKFSSDIDAYAKPAERLIRTVQMPLYALDSARLWPQAERFRLVHLYVSRKGVHSFVREQTVTLAQIVERAVEIRRLVARIQETSRATSQEDVPSNRKACHAYSGCPHQSVCTAFRRKPVEYKLTEDEMALFGIVPGDGPLTPKDHDQTEDARADVKELERQADALAAKNPDASGEADQPLAEVSIPLPVASTPQAQPAPAPEPQPAPAFNPADVVGGPKCADCPHPAHLGVQCTGKRGRGQCRCGASVTDAEAAGNTGDPGPKPGTGIPPWKLDDAPIPQSGEHRPALRVELELGPRAATILEKLAPALLELLNGR
jgi:hypothetical protein